MSGGQYYPNKSKNIMQVRSSLHNKKEKPVKLRRRNTNLIPSQHKSQFNIYDAKTIKQRTPSKSKSNSQKQNAKYIKKQTSSKSRYKISPLRIKDKQAPNSSPISHERNCLTKRSPLKSIQKKSKQIYSHREYQKNCQTSTKVQTQRTPVKKISQKFMKQKAQGKKKLKTSQSQEKTFKNLKNLDMKKKKNKQKNKAKFQITEQQAKIQDSVTKKKKLVPEINTRCPQRKQSYFDQQTLQRFNLDNAEYMRRKKYIKLQENDRKEEKKNATSTNINILSTISYRQYGTQTENTSNPPLSFRDLQSFRKQQELKWKIMCLELNQLKMTRTPQKIQQIIQESHKNISQFQIKCKQIVESQVKNQYFIQSPTKIRNALRRQRKSSEENKSLIKTLSDQKLLQELSILDNFEQLSQIPEQKQEKPSSSSFCLQFEKQLESYSQQIFASNQNMPFKNIKIEHIPELEFRKSNQIYLSIEENLLQQFCQQLLQKQSILHSYLLSCRQAAQEVELKIKCNQVYSVDLFYRLFKFIEDKQYSAKLFSQINTPLGDPPFRCLRLLRNYFIENEEQIYEDQSQFQHVLDSDFLNYFQSESYSSSIIENQYFYNHCVYRCINQIIDTLRPKQFFCLSYHSNTIKTPYHKSMLKAFEKIFEELKQILRIKIGRQQFNQYEIEPVKVAEMSYALLDKILVGEEQEKWKKIEQKIQEQKYFLAQYIVNDIFNQEIMMIYNEFS